MRIALSLQVRHVQCVPRTHNFLGNQRPGNLTNRLVETSSLISSTLIGYHRGAGVWLFDPGTPGVSRERGRDPPGPGATRHWSSLISLGHEFWEVGCPWTKMVGHPPSKTRSFRIERRGGKGREGEQREKGTYPPLLERRLSIRNRFSGHVREYPRSEMGSSMMQAFDVSIWKWFTL